MNEIVQYQGDAQALSLYMPVVDVRMAVERRNMIEAFTANVMVSGRDYGAIPGTSKPTLLKAGAEKLCSFFGLLPDFVTVERILDFDGSIEGRGEPLIYYRIRCDLYKNGVKVGSGEASCHSRESKYRWRDAAPTCPKCGAAAIRRGKDEYGGGYYCNAKTGGCGANFKPPKQSSEIAAIQAQPTGRIPNPDIGDLDNTILKMAAKRALVAATLIATNVSDFYTQDMEDNTTIEYTFDAPARPAPEVKTPIVTEPPVNGSKEIVERIRALGTQLYGDGWAAEAKALAAEYGFTWGKAGRESLEKVLSHLEEVALGVSVAEAETDEAAVAVKDIHF